MALLDKLIPKKTLEKTGTRFIGGELLRQTGAAAIRGLLGPFGEAARKAIPPSKEEVEAAKTTVRFINIPQQVAFKFAKDPTEELSIIKQVITTGREAFKFGGAFFRGEVPGITGRELLKTRGIDLDKKPSLTGEFVAAGLDVLAEPLLLTPALIRGAQKLAGISRTEKILKRIFIEKISKDPKVSKILIQSLRGTKAVSKGRISLDPAFQQFKATLRKAGVLDEIQRRIGSQVIRETLIPTARAGETFFFGGVPIRTPKGTTHIRGLFRDGTKSIVPIADKEILIGAKGLSKLEFISRRKGKDNILSTEKIKAEPAKAPLKPPIKPLLKPPVAPVSDVSQTALPVPPTPAKPAPKLSIEETELLPSASIGVTQEELKGAISKAEKNAIIIKNAQPKQLNFPSPQLDEHVTFYKSISLPTTSAIRGLQAQIARTNGLRLSGRISPRIANKRIKKLRMRLVKAAKREGIAVRVTKEGKELLSLRKAGTFVPVEFSEYKNFKDVKAIGGGGTDITRTIQGIDGSLSVKQKIQLPGQAGPAEKSILFRTREMAKQKSKWLRDRQELKERILAKIRRGSVEAREATKAMKFPEQASPEALAVANEMRRFFNDLIYEQNFMRMLRNQKIIAYRKNYAPETLRDATIWEKIASFNKQPKDITESPQLPDYIHPDKPFNPREQANNHGIPFEEQELDIHRLADSYISTAGRDIFNTSIIQNNKAFIQQLRSNKIENSAASLEKWNSEAYAGTRAALDKVLNFPEKVRGAMRAFNKIRNMGVFAFNYSWSIFTQTSSFALTIGRYGVANSTKGLFRWLTDSSLRRDTADKYYSFIIKAQRAGRVTAQDTDNIVGRDIARYRSAKEMVESAGFLFLEGMEKILTGSSIEAARLLGTQKGLTGEALDNFASDGGAKTQSMYNDEDKPGVLRSLFIKTVAPFQTFNFEVVNTMREWMGKTGTPPDDNMERFWQAIRFLSAATVASAMAWKGARKRVWFDLRRLPIPFAEAWLSPFLVPLTEEFFGQTRGLASPVQTARSIAFGIKDVIQVGNWNRLRREMIRYGSGLMGVSGGSQWARMVDASMAYARGGVFSRTGKLEFELKDPWDAVRAGFSGVFSSRGGTRFLKLRRAESREKKDIKTIGRRATLTLNRYKEAKLRGDTNTATQVWREWQGRYAKIYRKEFGKVLKRPTALDIARLRRRRRERQRLTPEEISRQALPGRALPTKRFEKLTPSRQPAKKLDLNKLRPTR